VLLYEAIIYLATPLFVVYYYSGTVMKIKQTSPKVLIVGASSKVAEAISRVIKMSGEIEIYYISSKNSVLSSDQKTEFVYCDFTLRKDIKDACMSIQPDIIINTAAYTDVDAAEKDKQSAWKVNVTGVENLVSVCRSMDAHLVHFSTDYVFDGEAGPYTETDLPRPLGYYGKTKMAGENACIGGNIDYTIIRTNVIYGAAHNVKPDFVSWVLNNLAERRQFSVVNDQFSNPTFIDDLGYLVDKVLRTRYTGIFNAGGATWLSRYDFACKIASIFKENKDLIRPISTKDLQQTAQRPMLGGLVTFKTETTFGMKFSSVESGLLAMRRQLQVGGDYRWQL
jgi:dTDP-4-dehydrorhamnose reductase